MKDLPHIGDLVCVPSEGGKQSARVVLYDPRIPGSVMLDKRIHRFQWWNKDELELVPEKRRVPCPS